MFFIFSQALVAAELKQACPSDHYFVHGHFRRAYTRADGTLVKASNVKDYCKPFSKGYVYAKTLFKTQAPKNWPNKTEKSISWKESEKLRIIEALDQLPEVLLSKNIEGFYRFSRSKDFPNPASSGNGMIAIYDSAFDSNRNLGRILTHEFAHQNLEELSKKNKQDYRLATGWHVKTDLVSRTAYWVGRKENYITEDGKNSFEEDYANNLEHFLYDPVKLKKVTPTAYEWFKKHFGEDFRLKEEK